MKILVINPGSTSTKIAVYENETPLLVRNIKHTDSDAVYLWDNRVGEVENGRSYGEDLEEGE